MNNNMDLSEYFDFDSFGAKNPDFDFLQPPAHAQLPAILPVFCPGFPGGSTPPGFEQEVRHLLSQNVFFCLSENVARSTFHPAPEAPVPSFEAPTGALVVPTLEASVPSSEAPAASPAAPCPTCGIAPPVGVAGAPTAPTYLVPGAVTRQPQAAPAAPRRRPGRPPKYTDEELERDARKLAKRRRRILNIIQAREKLCMTYEEYIALGGVSR